MTRDDAMGLARRLGLHVPLPTLADEEWLCWLRYMARVREHYDRGDCYQPQSDRGRQRYEDCRTEANRYTQRF